MLLILKIYYYFKMMSSISYQVCQRSTTCMTNELASAVHENQNIKQRLLGWRTKHSSGYTAFRTTRWKTTARAIYRVVNNYGTVKQSCKKAKLVPGGFSVCGLCWQKICCCSGPGPRLRPSVSGSGLRPFWRPADLWPSSG